LIDKLIAFSVRQRALVLVLSAIFILLGIIAATKVPIDAVPDVTNVQVQVLTPAPELGPGDVETYVTFPVERAMAGLPGLTEVRSTSRAGISVVTLVFDESTELYPARDMVDQRLNEARRNIPEGYGAPQLGPISSGLGEVYHFEVGVYDVTKESTQLKRACDVGRADACKAIEDLAAKKTPEGKAAPTLMERRTALEWLIGPRLRLVPGVVDVNVFGGEAKTLEVTLDPKRMATARVGVTQVLDAIRDNHLATGGAYIVDGRENLTVRGEGRVRTPEDVASIFVETREGQAPIYLRELAEVRFAPMVRYGAVTRDGRPDEAVVGVVMMLRGANSGDTVAAIKEEVEAIQNTLPPGMFIDPYYDRMELVERTIHTVGTNLIEASLLVVVVLLIMLVNLRAGAVVAVSIPLALLGVFIGMWAGGISGNLISLGAIDFGLVVDGAIIIVENALKRLAQKRDELGRPLTSEERSEVVIAAAREVRSATAFGEVIIALVYVPLLALQSVEGLMFRPMAMTVLFALGAAFVLSITLVPALASLVLPRDARDQHSIVMRAASRVYGPVFRAALHWPKVVVAATVALFFGSLAVAAGMGSEFLPKLDEGTVVIASVRLPSVSIEQSLELTRKVESTLKSFPEVTSVISRTGRAEIAVDPMGINMTDVYVMLKPKKEWKSAKDRDELVEAFDKKLLEDVPAVGFSFTQPVEMNTNDLLAGIESDLAIHLYGHDLGELRRYADKMVRTLKDIPGARDVRAEQIAGMNVLTVTVDRAAIARNGLSAKTVLDTIGALGGVDVGEIVDAGERYPIRVRLAPSARQDPNVIATLPVRTPSGALVPIGQLAKIDVGPGPSTIGRERMQRRITVQLNVRGNDIGTFVSEAKRALDREVKLPVGYYTVWAGEYERLQSATRQLAVVVPMVLALILVLLIATFGQFRPALLIFLNVPMSVSGGIAALAVRGLPLSISAGVGFIALFGVAVLNGLVLVSSIERLSSQGLSPFDAVVRGAEGRLRPVLTTAMVASLGFLPMALATGAGAEVQRPLATVVIGGIVSSTLLTLLVLPAMHLWLGRSRAKSTDFAPETAAPVAGE
jgi:cobalt-zinc-cadmium resistance protein CzcA